jgi:general secretion pathway protein G
MVIKSLNDRSRGGGFTLIELLIVLTVMALLLSIVAPRYADSHDRAKEAVLRSDLRTIRDCIDKFKADTGRLPQSLEELVSARYLRSVPVDPITDRGDTWLIVPSPDPRKPGVYDVKSGAQGVGRDGTSYTSW